MSREFDRRRRRPCRRPFIYVEGEIDADGNPIFPELVGSSGILIPEEIAFLDVQLPQRLIGSTWVLMYSLDKDGCALSQLYRKLKDWQGPTLLVIEDSNGHRFGAFIDDGIHCLYTLRSGPDCFLFRLKRRLYRPLLLDPNQEIELAQEAIFFMEGDYKENSSAGVNRGNRANLNRVNDASGEAPASGDEEAGNQQPPLRYEEEEHYVWEQVPDSRASGVGVSMGQKDAWYIGVDSQGMHGLWIDSNLERGTTATCDAFYNEPLTFDMPNGFFKAIKVEAWIFKW